ncbi:hypothetical protein FJTKL_11184 [Diaporthe vaccinii]|uniref:Uncharacterized protein n=1 Tax=Diaporthe vaccinii TaxID=105482 RepID=A0ABR4EI81_9PEZI
MEEVPRGGLWGPELQDDRCLSLARERGPPCRPSSPPGLDPLLHQWRTNSPPLMGSRQISSRDTNPAYTYLPQSRCSRPAYAAH